MTRGESIAERLREVLLNGHWIANTNIKTQIESITWQRAIHKIGTLNTIADLTFHINYYLGGLNDVFNGGELKIRDKYSFNTPAINSQSDWQKLINDFLTNAEIFIKYVEKMTDSKLDEYFVEKKYGTYQRNIEGTIEHCYYHLGQISLIKKLILAKKE